MDDELEDKVFYQTYVSHMKILSKFAVGVSSINSPLAYIWKLCRLYVLRPEVLFCGIILLVLLIYLQAVDVWSRGIFGRLQATLARQRTNRLKLLEVGDNNDQQSWEDVRQQSAAYAILGRRPRMEDRFIIEENINNNTGISFFAVFDGHGGEFAADFAKDILVKNIYQKIIETTNLLKGQQQGRKQQQLGTHAADPAGQYDRSPYMRRSSNFKNSDDPVKKDKDNDDASARRQNSIRKSHGTADDINDKKLGNSQKRDEDVFTSKLNSLIFGSGNVPKDTFNKNNNKYFASPPANNEPKCYIENGKINFGKLITDEVLAADYELVESAKKMTNIAGTTALIAIINGSKLFVANVGDSRGVMYNSRGVAIPLSFDHKPQQVRERKRIHDAGGFIAFRGVWRVAGILATSRALGDYPLKDKNLVIANPDILTFDLNDHKPLFLVLASDGLWDTFSNEEACNYIKEHLNEPDFGAKSLANQSYSRGSVDNITVLIIVFKNGIYRIESTDASAVPVSSLSASVAASSLSAEKRNTNPVSRSASAVSASSNAATAMKSTLLKRSNSAISDSN